MLRKKSCSAPSSSCEQGQYDHFISSPSSSSFFLSTSGEKAPLFLFWKLKGGGGEAEEARSLENGSLLTHTHKDTSFLLPSFPFLPLSPSRTRTHARPSPRCRPGATLSFHEIEKGRKEGRRSFVLPPSSLSPYSEGFQKGKEADSRKREIYSSSLKEAFLFLLLLSIFTKVGWLPSVPYIRIQEKEPSPTQADPATLIFAVVSATFRVFFNSTEEGSRGGVVPQGSPSSLLYLL